MYLLSEHRFAVEGVLENCWKCAKISRRVEVVTVLADRGKFSSMTFSLIRSCQDRSTGWARFVVTIASVGTVLDLVIIKILVVPSTFMLPPLALNSWMFMPVLILSPSRLACSAEMSV